MLAAAGPQLPTHIREVDQTAQWIFTLAQIVPIVLITALAIRWARTERTLVPVLFVIGGALAMLNEPIADKNGLVWFPTKGQWTLYETYGIRQPIWLAMAYVWFFGGQALLAWHWLEHRTVTVRDMWRVFALVVVVDILLEHPGLYMNLFFYYGHQPFKFTRFPLWWGAVNATIPIVSVTLVYLLRPHLRGWRVAAVVPLIPIVQAAVNAGVSWPVWNTINTDLPAAVVWAAGAVTLGLCALLVAICAEALARASARRAVGAPVAEPAPPTPSYAR